MTKMMIVMTNIALQTACTGIGADDFASEQRQVRHSPQLRAAVFVQRLRWTIGSRYSTDTVGTDNIVKLFGPLKRYTSSLSNYLQLVMHKHSVFGWNICEGKNWRKKEFKEKIDKNNSKWIIEHLWNHFLWMKKNF